MSRGLSYYDNPSASLSKNLYNPQNYGLNGQISAVFPLAGDSSKMYLIDSTSEELATDNFVVLELSANGDPENRIATIRPVFRLSNDLEPTWFKLN